MMTVTEVTPLLVSSQNKQHSFVSKSFVSNDTNSNKNNNTLKNNNTINTAASASYYGTIINMMKTCMGTGCLALAYACQQGGIILYIIGLLLIALWNYVVMFLLIDCLIYIPETSVTRTESLVYEKDDINNKDLLYTCSVEKSVPNSANEDTISRSDNVPDDNCDFVHKSVVSGVTLTATKSTMGRIAYYAFGLFGLQILDCVIIILFLGIITAYVAATITFLRDTPITINRWWDAILTGCIMGTIAIVPDIGYLSNASGIGLVVLLLAFLVIAGYGINDNVTSSTSTLDMDMNTTHVLSSVSNQLVLWPTSLHGISHYYGIVVFGYGLVPLTYNFHESMQQPKRIISAAATALLLVATSYILLGIGLYALFPNLTADVLHELPVTGIIPSMTRLAMVGTIITTAPLIIVPCSELLEGQWFAEMRPLVLRRAIVRYGLVFVCVIVAVVLPNFVDVLALVGCFCVALVSFCVPPALHLRVSYLAHVQDVAKMHNVISTELTNRNSFSNSILLDILLLLLGIIATIVSTACTLMK
jgi:amino acid permease